jgi:anti-anti-sigma regulatory factor
VDAGFIRVTTVERDPGCVITVSGELTLATMGEFTARAAEAIAASSGPTPFEVSGLDFVDCSGARALARAVLAVPPRAAGLYGCPPAVRRVLDALGLELPYRPGRADAVPGRPRPRPRPRPAALSRGEAMMAMTHAARANTRQTALYTSDVLSRLAATYSDLALSSRYRAEGKSEERGRLLALSGRALSLSRHYLRHAVSDAPPRATGPGPAPRQQDFPAR